MYLSLVFFVCVYLSTVPCVSQLVTRYFSNLRNIIIGICVFTKTATKKNGKIIIEKTKTISGFRLIL